MPAYTVSIGNRFGRKINELSVDIGTVPWILNDITKVDMRIASSDSKATARNIKVGNRVYIEFDSTLKLPAWGGTIEPPISWDYGTISFPVYSIEYLLQFRHTRKHRMFQKMTCGQIFRHVIREAEQEDPMGIVLGNVWMGGRMHTPNYHFTSLWDILKKDLHEKEFVDFRFVPFMSGGHIKWRAQLFEDLKRDRSQHFALKEGKNVSVNKFKDEGPIVNELAAVGAGSTWGDERATAVVRARSSARQHGLRQSSETFSNITQPGTLLRYARSALKRNAWPKTMVDLQTANAEPAKFSRYRVGDEVQCVLPSYGFGGYDEKVRIIAREYNHKSGDCRLVVLESKSIDEAYLGSGAEFMGEFEGE